MCVLRWPLHWIGVAERPRPLGGPAWDRGGGANAGSSASGGNGGTFSCSIFQEATSWPRGPPPAPGGLLIILNKGPPGPEGQGGIFIKNPCFYYCPEGPTGPEGPFLEKILFSSGPEGPGVIFYRKLFF